MTNLHFTGEEPTVREALAVATGAWIVQSLRSSPGLQGLQVSDDLPELLVG